MSRIQLNKVTYSGGHPQRPKGGQGFVLVADDKGLHLRRMTELFVIGWHEVTSIDVLGPEQAESRFTMTRLAALGPLALAAKKTTSDAYLHVTTATYECGFQVPKTSAGQLRSQLGQWIARVPKDQQPAPTAPPPQGPPAGWYPDPEGATAQRWWDGTAWTEHLNASG